tara:strand:- start:1948 stop:3633 length:1686 start_codon:yes stop_codon:yes gene_type:complete
MNEELFYDRTRNISGVSLIGGNDYTPSYGSSVAFSSQNMRFNTHNNYYQSVPMGVNSLKAKFSLVYKTDEDGAKKLANYYESSEGVNSLEVNTDPSVYRQTSGYCTDYSINHINNQNYEVRSTIEVVEAPGLLNWESMNFLNYNLKFWKYNQQYKKHDIVYITVNDLKLNNFYYCTEDHISSADNAPEQNDSSWSQDFFWEPDLGTNTQVQIDAVRYDGGLSVFNKIKKNTATFPINYSFSNISSNQLRSMLHFLENKGGYRRFKHQIKSVYNRPKVFICPSWNHTFVYNNNHNLQVSFQEDPLGVLPKKSTFDSNIVYTQTTNVYDVNGNFLSLPGQDNPLAGDIPTNYCLDNVGIRGLEIGWSCGKIGNFAFRNCENLSGTLTIPESVTYIGQTAFGNSNFVTNNKLSGDLIIPDSITGVGINGFLRASSFDGKIKLSESLTYIEQNSFRSLQGITGNLIVPNSVTGVGNAGFFDMRGLSSITIGSGVVNIEDEGFSMPFANSIDTIRILAPNPPTVGLDVFFGISTAENILYVPSGSSTVYNSAGSPWSEFTIIEDAN